MTPETLVASRELCEELVKAGVVLDTYFVWISLGGWEVIENSPDIASDKTIEWYPAPTAGELGEVLPEEIKLEGDERRSRLEFSQYKNDTRWVVFYVNELTESRVLFSANTEADARIKTLLYLLKSGYLKKEEVGERSE